MRQMQLDLDERCQKGSNFPSLRHQEVGHMAHNFFFWTLVLLLVTCTVVSVRALEYLLGQIFKLIAIIFS